MDRMVAHFLANAAEMLEKLERCSTPPPAVSPILRWI
jgi:hypothetical protein